MRCNQCRHLSPEEAGAVCAFEDCPHKADDTASGMATELPEEETFAGKIPVEAPEADNAPKPSGKCKSILTILKKAVKGSK